MRRAVLVPLLLCAGLALAQASAVKIVDPTDQTKQANVKAVGSERALTVRCVEGCAATINLGDAGLTVDSTSWFPDGGSIGYMRMPDGGALEVYVVNAGTSGGGWVPDGGYVGTVGQGPGQDGGAWAVSAASLPLPTGAATAANQTTVGAQTTKLNDGVDTANITSAGRLEVDGSGVTQPVSGSVTVSGTVNAAQSGTWNINNVSGTVSLPTGASTSALQTTGNSSLANIDTDLDVALSTRLAESTFTGRFPTATLLGDALSNPTTTGVGSYLLGWESGTSTWNRIRSSSVNADNEAGHAQGALDTMSHGYFFDGTDWDRFRGSVANGLLVDVSRITASLPSGTNYLGRTRLTDGTLDLSLLDSAPGSDTGQVSVPVRIISSLAGGAGGTSSSYGSAFPATGTAAGFSDGTNMQGARVFDADTGAGSQYVLGANLRVSASGGSTEAAAGAGVTSASTLRVVLPTDQTAIPATQSGTWTVTANAGTNLNTSALALDATVGRAQASSTSGQTGPLVQGAVTTSAPTYTNATTNPLSLTTAGALRVDGSGSTQPVSGTVTANAGTGNFTVVQATASNLNTTADTELPAAAALADATANPTVTSIGSFGLVYNGTTWDRLRGSSTLGVTMNLANFGGSAVTLGQKTSANSMPVVIASDQSAVTVAQATASNLRAQTASESTTNAALPSVASAAGFSDGTKLQIPRVIDADTSSGTVWTVGSAVVGPGFGSPTVADVEGVAPANAATGLYVWKISKDVGNPVTTSVTCTASATAAPASPLANRVTGTFVNNSNVTIYLGGSAVTTSTGIPLLPGASFTDDIGHATYYCIVASGTADLRVLEN